MSDQEQSRFSLTLSSLSLLIVASLALGAWLSLSLLSPSHSHQEEPKHQESHRKVTKGVTKAAASWTCSMHPQVQAPERGLCPLCGMDLIEANDEPHPFGEEETALSLSPRARALARVRTSTAELRSLENEGRTLWGEVSVDDEERSVVSAWIAGRIERLLVSKVGDTVKRGQALAELYSPDVYSAHQALIDAVKSKNSRTKNTVLKATRERLRQLGVSATQLKYMEKASSPWKKITIRSKTSGVVVSAQVEAGAYVSVGQPLLRVVDLSQLQVKLRLSERELSDVSVGERFLLETASIKGHLFEGVLSLIEPQLDKRGRFAIAQLTIGETQYSIEESSGELISLKKKHSARGHAQLLPGMLVTARSLAKTTAPTLQLSIPRSAPLFAGERSLVYVAFEGANNEERYEARVVLLGEKSGEYYPVLSGLRRGERVVTRGAFLLDSESQIRGLFSLSELASTRNEPSLGHDRSTQSSQSLVMMPSSSSDTYLLSIKSYLELQEALAEGQEEDSRRIAKRWYSDLKSIIQGESSLEAVRRVLSRDSRSLWDHKLTLLKHDLKEAIAQQSIAQMRARFEMISAHILSLLAAYGNPLDEVIHEAYCPMAFNNRGALWAQRGDEVNNVYFGDQMRRCGELKRPFGPPSQSLKSLER